MRVDTYHLLINLLRQGLTLYQLGLVAQEGQAREPQEVTPHLLV